MHSICPHCKSTSFEVKTQTPTHSNYKVVFVQCSGCGAPFGALPFFDQHGLLISIESRIKGLESKLSR